MAQWSDESGIELEGLVGDYCMPVMIVTLKCPLLIPFGPWFPRSVVVLLAVTPVHTRDEGRDLVGDFFLASVG